MIKEILLFLARIPVIKYLVELPNPLKMYILSYQNTFTKQIVIVSHQCGVLTEQEFTNQIDSRFSNESGAVEQSTAHSVPNRWPKQN